MKTFRILPMAIVGAGLLLSMSAVASEKAPIALTEAQMDQVVAAGTPAHQSIASVLKGDTASIMPGHVVGAQPGRAHQSLASSLKGDTASIMPGHVSRGR